ncbi:MAG: hypothetical protein JOY64_21605 [Alphaproteobacteria bacterium]|nr:hypothetical protein [Alphaproteobacteria bacterium]MBV8410240.1 hypothetical protein [Alphaproteobacteria bacterium]
MNTRSVALFIIVLVLGLALAACARTDTVHLRNPQTGQEVTCGPYPFYALRASASAQLESQCIQDFEKQGFLRLAKAD